MGVLFFFKFVDTLKDTLKTDLGFFTDTDV